MMSFQSIKINRRATKINGKIKIQSKNIGRTKFQ